MKKGIWKVMSILLLCLMLFIAVLSSCLPKGTPAPTITSPLPPATATPPKLTWQQEWDRLIDNAQKEGTVLIYTSITPEMRTVISKAVKDKFEVSLDFVAGRPAEYTAKLLTEQKAGLYLGDVIIGGSTTMPPLKLAGALDPLEPLLLLPEVLDRKAWFGGDIVWMDSEHYCLAFIAGLTAPVMVNTQLVKPGEIKSYKDLLEPKWKGGIVFSDPTVPGGGMTLFTSLALGIMDMDYLYQLAKQELIISKDQRLMAEWIARGKYPIVMGLSREIPVEFLRVGAPVAIVTPVEGTYIGAGSGGLALLKRAAHPNAAKLFVNWLLSKEGQTLYSRAMGSESARVDVPSDFLLPEMIRQPGEKYFPTIGFEYALEAERLGKLARDIFGIK